MAGTDLYYNGVLLQDCQIREFVQDIEYDESGSDPLYSRFRISVSSTLVPCPKRLRPSILCPKSEGNTQAPRHERRRGRGIRRAYAYHYAEPFAFDRKAALDPAKGFLACRQQCDDQSGRSPKSKALGLYQLAVSDLGCWDWHNHRRARQGIGRAFDEQPIHREFQRYDRSTSG